jgi:6-pyruvoyl-tetrahydropterin synthase
MYKVGVTGEFTAVHSLVGDVSAEEKKPHPHNYYLEWTLWVENLDERGFSLDISLLEEIRDEFFHGMSRKVLNDIAWFEGKQTSLEYLCRYMFDTLSTSLRKFLNAADILRISKMETKVWENDSAWAAVNDLFDEGRST